MRAAPYNSTMPHGTYARYKAGCSCLECCYANAAFKRDLKRGKGNPRVDAAPARRHVERLKRSGMSYNAIARAAGVHRNTVQRLHLFKRTTLQQATAEAILAVTDWQHEPRSEARLVLDDSVVDRILDVTGYELAAVLDAADLSLDAYQQVRRGRRRVSQEWAERFARALGVRVESLFTDAA